MLCLANGEGFDSDGHDRGRGSGEEGCGQGLQQGEPRPGRASDEEGWGGAPAGMWARLGARLCLRDMLVALGRGSTLGGYRTEEGRADGQGRAPRARVDEEGDTRG